MMIHVKRILTVLLPIVATIVMMSCIPPIDAPPENPSPTITGRWVMDAGVLEVTYRFYDDGTFERENSTPSYGAGYYTYVSSTLTFRAIGHAEEVYTVSLSGDTMMWSQNGSTVAAFTRQSTLDKPTDNPPTVTIPEGNTSANVEASVTFTATATDADTTDTLEYQWYVDGVAVNSETGTSFSYIVPAGSATSHTIKVVVSDQKQLATASVILTVNPVAHGFKRWDTGTNAWVDMGIAVPDGTLSAFSTGSDVAVLTSEGVIESYSSGTWTAYSPAAPSGMVLASSFTSGENVAITTADSSGHVYIYSSVNASSGWVNLSDSYSFTLSTDVVNIAILASGLITRTSAGSISVFNFSASPPAWGSFPYTLPSGTVRFIFSDGLTGFPGLMMSDRTILRENTTDLNTWDSTGIVAPAGAIEVFYCGTDLVSRQ